MTGLEAIKSAITRLKHDLEREREGISDIVFEPEVRDAEERIENLEATIERLLVLLGEFEALKLGGTL